MDKIGEMIRHVDFIEIRLTTKISIDFGLDVKSNLPCSIWNYS